MKNLQGFRKRMLISSAFFILIVTLLCLGVVYYWSFFHFSHLFEDRVIDQLPKKSGYGNQKRMDFRCYH